MLGQFFTVFHSNKASILGEVIDDKWMSGTGLWINDFYKSLLILKHLWLFLLCFLLSLFWQKLGHSCHIFSIHLYLDLITLDWLMTPIFLAFEEPFCSIFIFIFFGLITQDLGWTLVMMKQIHIEYSHPECKVYNGEVTLSHKK